MYICISDKGKYNTVQENNNFTQNEEKKFLNVKNYKKQQVFKIVKEKKRIREEQRRNCNTLQIHRNLKSTNWRKNCHVSRILQKQNLANTLKSYAMCNL